MKKIEKYSLIMVFAIYTFVPLCSFIALLGEYEFSLRNITVLSSVIMAISLFQTILVMAKKELNIPKKICVFAVFSLPMSLLNYFCFMLQKGFTISIALLMGISCICAGITFMKCGYPLVLKLIIGVISFMAIMILPLFTLMFLVFGNIQYSTVVKNAESPDGTYLAVVIDSDQGALGGDTYVDVYDQKQSFSIYIAEFTKVHSRVYQGDWGEYKHMEIEWKDKNTLLINGKLYLIN